MSATVTLLLTLHHSFKQTPVYGLFSRTTSVSQYQKHKAIIMRQEMIHRPDHTHTIRSCSQNTIRPTLHHSIFTGQMLFQTPNQQLQSNERKKKHDFSQSARYINVYLTLQSHNIQVTKWHSALKANCTRARESTKCRPTGEQWCAGQWRQLSQCFHCQPEQTCCVASAPVKNKNIASIPTFMAEIWQGVLGPILSFNSVKTT